MSRRGGLVALCTAAVVTALGTRISMLAIPWLVLVTTGDPALMGLIAGAEMVPYVLSGVLAAPLADRVGLRRASVVADAGSALATVAVAVIPGLGFPALAALVAVIGALRGVGDRVKNVLLRPMAEAAGVPIAKATAVFEGLNRTGMLVGAPLGGLLIFWLGARGAVLVDGGTFAVCAAVVGALVRPGTPRRGRAEPYLAALRSGARHLAASRMLLAMIMVTFLLNLFSQASVAVFIPVWVSEVLGSPAGLGLILGAYAGGAVVGSVGVTALATRLPPYRTFALGAVLGSAPRLLVLGLSHELALVLAVTFLSGVATSAVNPILVTLMYERVPVDLHTRVFGLAAALSFAGLPVGGVLGGLAVAGLGLDPAVLVAGVLSLTLSLLPMLYVRVRHLDHSAQPPLNAPA